MLGNRETNSAGQFVAASFYEIIKCLLGIELRIEILGHSRIEGCGRLVTACGGLWTLDTDCIISLHVGGETMGLVGHNTIGESYSSAEALGEDTAQQVNIILLQVLIYIRTWNLHQQRLVLVGEGLEDDW